jgi:hypothetical protein
VAGREKLRETRGDFVFVHKLSIATPSPRGIEFAHEDRVAWGLPEATFHASEWTGFES